jgi:hypothetical protein
MLLASLLLFFHLAVLAQEKEEVEMADAMRENGRIYVVVAVVITIFIGLIIYLVRLDRKITNLEKTIS